MCIDKRGQDDSKMYVLYLPLVSHPKHFIIFGKIIIINGLYNRGFVLNGIEFITVECYSALAFRYIYLELTLDL